MKKLIPLFLCSFAVAQARGQAEEQDAAKVWELRTPGLDYARLMVRVDNRKIEQPKISPKNKWQFDFVAAAYGRPVGPPAPFQLRFRIYSQYRKTANDPAQGTAFLLARLWDYNAQRLRLDHREFYGTFIDVYLCFGGKAGGEQLFDEDDRGPSKVNVNTIYIYDVTSFTDPLEMVRELAHEYGHAALPAVGGFASPENWGNGFLGEQLYLTWLRRDLAAKSIGPENAFGVTVPALDEYLKTKVVPNVAAVRQAGPDWDSLAAGKTMDPFLGVAMYAESILPPSALSRAMQLNAKLTGAGFADAVVEAAQEVPKWTVSGATGAIFLPLGTSKLVGGKVISRKRGWAKVQPTTSAITVLGKPQP